MSEIKVYEYPPEASYEELGPVRTQLNAITIFARSPSEQDALRDLLSEARALGATAIIGVRFRRGPSVWSWRSLRASGIAVRIEAQKTCPFCAETVKQAAIRCKHCGAELPAA